MIEAGAAPTFPSSASERLVRALEAHAAAEAHDLAGCEALVQGSADPVLKQLLGMIVDDQRRHQSMLDSMVRQLRLDDVGYENSNAAACDPEQPVELRALIRDEHEAARHLRYVARQERDLYAGLYTVLLEAIARDSEKHATILRYLLLRAEGRAT